MQQTYQMPDAGEGLTEAELVSWKVAEGDRVSVHDVVAEIETAKSLVELPAPWSGTVAQLLVAEGTTVDVGTPIMVIDDGAGSPADPGDAAPAGVGPAPEGSRAGAPSGGDDEASGPNLIGYGPQQSVSRRRRPRREGDGEEQPTLAKPPARRLAQRLGIDLSQVTGTGRDGAITRVDVLQAQQDEQGQRDEPAPQQAGAVPSDAPQPPVADQPVTAPAEGGKAQGGQQQRLAGYAPSPRGPMQRLFDQAAAAAQPFTRTRASGVRRATAEAVTESADRHVHVTEWTTVDVTATMELVAELKRHRDFKDLHVSPLLIHAKAVCLALRRHPDLNATWEDDPGDILHHGGVNLGIAAATPRGLLVPNVKNADQLSLLELCRALNGLITTAREGRTQPLDCQHGTFTITNVGIFGVEAGTPVINGDESAILCMGSIDRRPWVVGSGADERIEPRWVSTLALTFDHKIIDGEGGSRFLRDVADLLNDPGKAFLY